MTEKIESLLEQIKFHYQFQNNDELEVLLEGLADSESKGVTYWDYIEVDTLLSLQKPKTNYPDEIIFIAYHQIHELYFKLLIQELEKIIHPEKFKPIFLKQDEVTRWNDGLKRATRYMNKLIQSFDVLKDGLSSEFKTFRKSLLPASGFQTHQFRLIEIMLTSFENLISDQVRARLPKELDVEKDYKHIYWRSGAMRQDNGEPTKLLVNFNDKYDDVFLRDIKTYKYNNIYSRFLRSDESFQNSVKQAMSALEKSILVWKIAHINAISVHINVSDPGTGGTPWHIYLPVRNQKIFYFPEFWKGKEVKDEIRSILDEYPEMVKKEFKKII